MKKPSAKQLNLLAGQAMWSTNLQLGAGNNQSVTGFFTGKTSGGSDTTVGVITTEPHNKIFLRLAGSGQPVKDPTTGVSVFARLTETAGAWNLAFFTLVNGTEVSFDTTGHEAVGTAINFRYCEVVQYANYKPTSIVYAGEGIDEYDASSPASHQHIIDTITITANGQSAIQISQTPKDANDVEMLINTAVYHVNKHFTISGTTITWTNTAANGGFDLETTDDVAVVYAYAG